MAPRRLLAAAISPLLALLLFWLGAVVAVGRLAGRPVTLAEAAHALFFFGLLGAPLVYLGTWVLAVPAYVLLARRGRRLAAGPVIALAAVLGALWAAGAGTWLLGGAHGPGTDLLGLAGLGAVAGGAGGACFCALGGLRPRAPRVAS
jgi:hypothetical protein